MSSQYVSGSAGLRDRPLNSDSSLRLRLGVVGFINWEQGKGIMGSKPLNLQSETGLHHERAFQNSMFPRRFSDVSLMKAKGYGPRYNTQGRADLGHL